MVKLRSKTCLAILILIALMTVSSGNQLSASPLGAEPVISAQAAILVEQSSGQVLFSKAANERMYPASLTKLLSVLVILQSGGSLDQTVTVGQELQLVKPDSSKAGLAVGDRISLRDLLYAMLLPSGNDAAYVAATYTARVNADDPNLPADQAIRSFVALMNQLATELGATHSHFANPDGYHDSRHYTTAADLALIASQVMRNDFLQQAVGQDSVSVAYISHGQDVTKSYDNTNRLLDPTDSVYYPQATGLKTGTTPEAGYCLAATASSRELDLIAVILDSSEDGRWQDARRLLDYGLNEHQLLELCTAGEEQLTARLASSVPGFFAEASVVSQRTANVVVSSTDAARVTSQFIWDESLVTVLDDRVVISAQAKNGTVVGRQTYSLDQAKLVEVPIVLDDAERIYLPSPVAAVLLLAAASGLSALSVRRRGRQRGRGRGRRRR